MEMSASTSLQNQIDQLIGPDTVNTVPPATLNAVLDHGTPAITLTILDRFETGGDGLFADV